MIEKILITLSPWGPVIFGIAFLAPLFATLMVRAGADDPFGIAPIWFGLVLGGLWGLYAKLKGSWL